MAIATGVGLPTATPTLFPNYRKAVRIDPVGVGTADCKMTCRCDDSCDYAIKDATSHASVPHAEFFCTSLGELIGISAPPFAVVELLPGDPLVFGSRWLGGAVSGKATKGLAWWQLVQNNTLPLADIRTALSRIYAFDHFVHNVDRHANNFLVTPQLTGHAVLAFDYSRAWTVHGFPLPSVPLP